MDKKNEACSPAEKVGKAAERAGQLSFQLFVATRHDLTDESAAVVADMATGLAEGISAGAINGYESGSYAPGADKICALASALGCTPNDLFCWGK